MDAGGIVRARDLHLSGLVQIPRHGRREGRGYSVGVGRGEGRRGPPFGQIAVEGGTGVVGVELGADYGGRIGAFFGIPVAGGSPVGGRVVAAVFAVRGRVALLRVFVVGRIVSLPGGFLDDDGDRGGRLLDGRRLRSRGGGGRGGSGCGSGSGSGGSGSGRLVEDDPVRRQIPLMLVDHDGHLQIGPPRGVPRDRHVDLGDFLVAPLDVTRGRYGRFASGRNGHAVPLRGSVGGRFEDLDGYYRVDVIVVLPPDLRHCVAEILAVFPLETEQKTLERTTGGRLEPETVGRTGDEGCVRGHVPPLPLQLPPPRSILDLRAASIGMAAAIPTALQQSPPPVVVGGIVAVIRPGPIPLPSLASGHVLVLAAHRPVPYHASQTSLAIPVPHAIPLTSTAQESSIRSARSRVMILIAPGGTEERHVVEQDRETVRGEISPIVVEIPPGVVSSGRGELEESPGARTDAGRVRVCRGKRRRR
mmetsp:Transcript_55296/g.165739  ORF Transcript_55296/g.165739 Transcript_55296/m.165739 type:complete len:475 (+) Transcript_55296:693-2117(+)